MEEKKEITYALYLLIDLISMKSKIEDAVIANLIARGADVRENAVDISSLGVTFKENGKTIKVKRVWFSPFTIDPKHGIVSVNNGSKDWLRNKSTPMCALPTERQLQILAYLIGDENATKCLNELPF